MSTHELKVQCPFCEGKGELVRSDVAERFSDPDLRKRLNARIVEILEESAVTVGAGRTRDFQKEVHTWNPALPIWRRSPKE